MRNEMLDFSPVVAKGRVGFAECWLEQVYECLKKSGHDRLNKEDLAYALSAFSARLDAKRSVEELLKRRKQRRRNKAKHPRRGA